MKRRLKDILILHEYIDEKKKATKKYSKKIYRYLYTAPIIGLEGLGTNAVRTDGVWTWSDAIAESYKNGEILLPENFISHVNKHIFSYPFWFAFKEYILRFNLRNQVNVLINKKIAQREKN